MLANLLASPSLVGLMWDVVPHYALLTWLAVIYITCTLTYIYYLYLKPLFKNLETIPELSIYYLLPLTFGVLWGVAGLLFYTPDSIIHVAYLIMFLFGMASGAVNALSSLWLSYALLVIPILMPFTIRLYYQGNAHSFYTGLTILSFLAVMLIISRMTRDSIGNSLKIRYENVELLEKLQKQTIQAQKANQDKSRFLASASHDLRQPVHSLSLLASAIVPEISTDRGKKILSQIGNANEAMLNLLNSLLDISKLDAGIIKPEIRVFNLQNMVNSLINEFQPIANENNLELRNRHCPYIVKSDPVLLKTIISNLLQNAVRYTKEGKILIACRKRNNKIIIQVWDTGNGIAKDHQEIIFAEYQQLHNPERAQNKGLGLGLSICRRLATLLNIQIGLKSVVGKGSVFTLELPILSDNEIEAYLSVKSEVSIHPDNIKALSGAVILVIDDNHTVLNAMSLLLENWGCKVYTADGLEATVGIGLANKDRINVIIADYRLCNDTTGAEAISAFNEIVEYTTPSILITGDTSPERMQEIVSHGLPVLHKPIKEPHLKSIIGKLLRSSS